MGIVIVSVLLITYIPVLERVVALEFRNRLLSCTTSEVLKMVGIFGWAESDI